MAATTGGYTRGLAEFAHDMRLADVPEDVKHETLRILIDCMGCAVAGLVTPGTQIAVDLVKDEHGPLEATVISAGRASLAPAAFANAIAINAQDFDVYGPEAHLAPVTMAAALAAGDAVNASGSDVLAAMVAGLEVGGRVGAALRRAGMGGERVLGHVRGEGNTVFGAVTAAARLLGLTRDQMHHALGIAGYGATVPTMRKFLGSKNLPMVKYDHLGAMTQNGIQAALLAMRGFTGDLEVLEGEDIGFWRFAGAQGCDWDAFTTELGRRWIIPDVTYKHYPAVLYTNSIIYEAQRLVRENKLTPDEIDRVEVRASRTEAPPPYNPSHYLEAWHNPAYSVAAGIYDVRPLRSWEEPHVFQRPDLLAFMKKVHFAPLRPGEVTTKGNYWERWAPTRVTIEARGQKLEGGRDYHVPMDDASLAAKLQENIGSLVSEQDARELERCCWELERLARSSQLTDILGRSGRPD
jgi:2-methylcitrate dehydratase PrpD